jgi:hypothetical protein
MVCLDWCQHDHMNDLGFPLGYFWQDNRVLYRLKMTKAVYRPDEDSWVMMATG